MLVGVTHVHVNTPIARLLLCLVLYNNIILATFIFVVKVIISSDYIKRKEQEHNKIL